MPNPAAEQCFESLERGLRGGHGFSDRLNSYIWI